MGAPEPKGRQAKARPSHPRFDELSSHEYQKRNETNEIFIPVAERLGNEVIEFRTSPKLRRPPADRQPVVPHPPGAIVGIIGPNGAGKSTLFKLITGTKAGQYEVIIGQRCRWPSSTSPARTCPTTRRWGDVSGGADILQVGRFQMQSRAYIGRFNFKRPRPAKIVGNLLRR